jgi:hypothetical protein
LKREERREKTGREKTRREKRKEKREKREEKREKRKERRILNLLPLTLIHLTSYILHHFISSIYQYLLSINSNPPTFILYLKIPK